MATSNYNFNLARQLNQYNQIAMAQQIRKQRLMLQLKLFQTLFQELTTIDFTATETISSKEKLGSQTTFRVASRNIQKIRIKRSLAL
jgi:hypothetical protein